MSMRNRVLAWLGCLALILSGIPGGNGARAEWQEETKNGKVVRRTWVDETGKEAVSPEGYAVVTMSYSNGTTVKEKYFDLDGNPATAMGGYYGRILVYGNRHRLEEVTYIDEEGGRMDCSSGYARVRTVYTSTGRVTKITYFDSTNDMVFVPSVGYAQVKNDYRGSTLTKTSYYDENKKLIDSPLGYAVMIQTVNKNNFITGASFQHADGSPAVSPEGWASMKREMDRRNREISIKYYDLDGNLMDRGGYAYEVRDWDSDKLCTIDRYDVQDQQIPMGPGYMSLRRELNGKDQVYRETCLDQNGVVTENAEGYAICRYEYDPQGRLTKVVYEDSMGAPKEKNGGYAAYQDVLDEAGFTLSRTYLSKTMQRTDIAEGYCEIRYQYDGSHQISQTEYYTADGKLLKSVVNTGGVNLWK